MRLGGGRVMHEDVLLAVLVEVHQPSVFLVGHGDRHLLRPPGGGGLAAGAGQEEGRYQRDDGSADRAEEAVEDGVAE